MTNAANEFADPIYASENYTYAPNYATDQPSDPMPSNPSTAFPVPPRSDA